MKAAPLSFLGFLMLGGILTTGLYEVFIIPGKNATIEQWEAKAETGPSVEQAKVIEDLRSTVKKLQDDKLANEADEWPALTDEQISTWVSTLSKLKIKSITVFWSQDVNAKELYKSIKTVGDRLKIKVESGEGNAEDNAIVVESAQNDTTASAIFGLFAHEGYMVKFSFENSTGPSEDIMIFIGPNPTPKILPRRQAPAS